MLEARKENKVYQINNQQKDRYLKEGFDIYEDGQIVEHTPKKVIKYSDHLSKMKTATAEIELLKTELDSKETATAEQDKEIKMLKEQLASFEETKIVNTENVLDLLKGYAAAKSIDIGSSTSASGVLNKILEVEKE